MAPSPAAGVFVTPARYWTQTVKAITQFATLDTPVTITSTAANMSATVNTPALVLHIVRAFAWPTVIGEHTMSVPARALKDRKYRISAAGGWHTMAGDTPHAKRTTKPKTARSAITATITGDMFLTHLTSMATTPTATHLQFAATPAGAVGISCTSPAVSSTISSGAIDATANVVAVPVDVASALATLLNENGGTENPDLHVTVDVARSALTIANTGTTVTITCKTPHPIQAWPVKPNPDLERHDLIITDLTEWNAVTDQHRAITPPFPTAHLRWDRDQSALSVLARIAPNVVDIAMPATSSDRFALDVPWPALQAILAPTETLEQVSLRYFTPNPTLTYLIADFHDGPLSGFAFCGARRPDTRLNS